MTVNSSKVNHHLVKSLVFFPQNGKISPDLVTLYLGENSFSWMACLQPTKSHFCRLRVVPLFPHKLDFLACAALSQKRDWTEKNSE
jgi:hypothetical protein